MECDSNRVQRRSTFLLWQGNQCKELGCLKASLNYAVESSLPLQGTSAYSRIHQQHAPWDSMGERGASLNLHERPADLTEEERVHLHKSANEETPLLYCQFGLHPMDTPGVRSASRTEELVTVDVPSKVSW